MDAKKIGLNQIINLLILCVFCLIALNIFKGENKKIVELHQMKQDQVQKNQTLQRIADKKERIKFYREKFKQKDYHQIINTITRLAHASEVKIISLVTTKQVPEEIRPKSEIYDRIFFELVVEIDSYHKLGKFISKLESDPMMFSVNSVRLSHSSGAQLNLFSELAKIRVDLIIGIMYFK